MRKAGEKQKYEYTMRQILFKGEYVGKLILRIDTVISVFEELPSKTPIVNNKTPREDITKNDAFTMTKKELQQLDENMLFDVLGILIAAISRDSSDETYQRVIDKVLRMETFRTCENNNAPDL